MGVEVARAAKVFDAHLPLNLRRFQAALPTPRSSAMAHQTLPRVRQAPGKPRPPAHLHSGNDASCFAPASECPPKTSPARRFTPTTEGT